MTIRRPRSKRSIRRATRLFGALSIAAATLVAPNAADAQAGCGELSVEFDGVRLLNNGVDNNAGPFAINLPAGTYDVTLIGYDFHNEQPNVGTQPGEQFVVALDNGYVSPPSIDIPDDVNSSTVTHGGQVISSGASSLTLRHLGVPGVNSVDPQCVGFTLVDAGPAAEAPVDASTDPADPSVDISAAGDAACTVNPDSSSAGASSEPVEIDSATGCPIAAEDGPLDCDSTGGAAAAGDDAAAAGDATEICDTAPAGDAAAGDAPAVCDSTGDAAAGDDAAAPAGDATEICDTDPADDAPAGDAPAVCDSTGDAAAAGDDAAAPAGDATEICDTAPAGDAAAGDAPAVCDSTGDTAGDDAAAADAPAGDAAAAGDATEICDTDPAGDAPADGTPADDAPEAPATASSEAVVDDGTDGGAVAVAGSDAGGTDGGDAAAAAGTDGDAASSDAAAQPSVEVQGIAVENNDDAAAATTATTAAPAAAAATTATTTAGVAAAQAGQLAVTGSYNAISFALVAFGLLLIGMSFVLASDKERALAYAR